MKKSIFMLMIATMIFQGVALAKEITGTVSAVNAGSNKLTISAADETGAAKDMEITISPEVVYTGVSKLDELTVGTKVRVNADQNAAGAWEAKQISVANASKGAAANAGSTASAPAAGAQQ